MKKLFFCTICLFLMTGCADTIPYKLDSFIQPVGFWYGLWHGMILPFAWFWSLFSDNTAIYAAYNNGGWYDFGFMLGVGSLGGSSSVASRR